MSDDQSGMQVSYKPAGRVAMFIDGDNLRAATLEAMDMRVDFIKLLDLLTGNGILIRAYYYTGVFAPVTIDRCLELTNPTDPVERRKQLVERAERERTFHKVLARSGFKVVTKPVKVMRRGDGRLRYKADLDIELAIGMLTMADKCDRMVLVSGDGDFIPVVHAVGDRGVRVVVVSTQSHEVYVKGEYRASDELIDAADEYIDIYDIRSTIELEVEHNDRI